MLRNIVVNLNKDSHATTSNQIMLINLVQSNFKEEERMHQMKDDMDIGQQNSPSNVGQEESINHYVFR
jgi:hypothetical protein